MKKFEVQDSHTYCLKSPTLLTFNEKRALGIPTDKHAYINEIGFSTPTHIEAWEEDCFSVIYSSDLKFNEVNSDKYPIRKMPKRFENTLISIYDERSSNPRN